MSTRFLTTLFLAVLSLAAAAALWYSFGMPGFGGPLPEESEYRNARYDYRFSYPRTLTLNEYSTRYTTLVTQDGETARDVLAATVAHAPESSRYASFDAFVRSQLPPLCAADVAVGTVSCSGVASSTTFTAESGAEAMAYTVELTIVPSSGEVETRTFGPVYAYDLTEDGLGAPFTALLVYAPAARVVEGTVDAEFIESLAHSLTLGESAAPETP